MMRAPWRTAACALFGATALSLQACGKKDVAEDAPKPTAEVTTAILRQATLDRTMTAYGAVEFAPGAERTLSSPIEARVVQVLATAGSPVGVGQTVIVLSPSPQAEVDARRAADDATVARQAYERAVRLQSSGLASNADLEAARAADVLARATLQSTRQRLGGLTVKSAVSGVLETLTAAPGDLVASGASLGKVGQLSAVRVRLGVDPAAAVGVRAGQAVRLRVGTTGPEIAGRVESLDPQVDAQTRLSSVIVTAEGARLSPGQPVRGEIVLGRVAGPVIPQTAIYYDQDKPYILVVDKGVARHRDVTLGASNNGQVEVASGAAAGDRVVVEGGASLDDGVAVKEAAPVAADKDAG